MEPRSCLNHADLRPPQLFISSTLEGWTSEIRNQIGRGLETAGYLPMMSELGSFSYSHSDHVHKDTVNVVSGSQVYVLVIGRRYGTVSPDRDVSITELEYRRARMRGLPIFVYVLDSVWQGFEAYRNGSVSAENYSHWVDDIRALRFIRCVAEEDGLFCRQFHNGHEVLDDLRGQLANLLGGYLRFQAKAAEWLWTEQFAMEFEASAKLVWVLTPDFYWDFEDRECSQIVLDNVAERRTRYFYIFADSEENRERVGEMERHFASAVGESWQESVHFTAIPKDQFNWCAEQVLFNPGDPKHERGIIVDAMDARNKADKFSFALSRAKLLAFRHQFERLWNTYGKGELGTLAS